VDDTLPKVKKYFLRRRIKGYHNIDLSSLFAFFTHHFLRGEKTTKLFSVQKQFFIIIFRAKTFFRRLELTPFYHGFRNSEDVPTSFVYQ